MVTMSSVSWDRVGTLWYNSVHPKNVDVAPHGEGTAIGNGAYAVADSVAVGNGSRALNEGEFSVGDPGTDSGPQRLRRVSNVAEPEYGSDAATKAYVDSAIKVTDRRFPEWDSDRQEFTNKSISEWLRYNSDGKVYGVDQSEDKVSKCEKTLANSGIENPVPCTLLNPGSDPYSGRGPFRWYDVNGYVDADGTQHVTGMRDFGNFSWDRDVFVLSPVRYVFDGEVDGRWRHASCDTAQSGLVREARATLPNGVVAPYMLRSKFVMSVGTDGIPMSVPVAKPRLFDVSFNSMGELAKKKGAAYSGITCSDDAYLYDMFLLKYANKSSSSVFSGCTRHKEQTMVTVANKSSSAVIIAKEVARLLPVGSSVEVGSHAADTAGDRYDDDMMDLASQSKIIGKEDYDDSNVALTLDCDPFDSAVGNWVSTMPWETGACRDLHGDGSPTSCLSGREPYVLQGIELMIGAYEIAGDVIVRKFSDTYSICAINSIKSQSQLESDNLTRVFDLPRSAANSGDYVSWSRKVCGMWVPAQFGASSTSGSRDYVYWRSNVTTVDMTCRIHGSLNPWVSSGLCTRVLSTDRLSTGWGVSGRLSTNGTYGLNASA